MYSTDDNNIAIPIIPINASFEAKDIRSVILSKFVSCMINDKLTYMYSHPRKLSLHDLAIKYITPSTEGCDGK